LGRWGSWEGLQKVGSSAMTSTPKGRARGRERAFVYYIIMSRPQPQYPLPQYLFLTFILSLAMDIEEIETLLRKPFYTEEDCDCQFVQFTHVSLDISTVMISTIPSLYRPHPIF